MTAVLFAAAAGLGAATRLGVNTLGWTWLSTLAVNVVGSLLLGWLIASQPTDATLTVVGTGYLGSLTTFSMFAIEAGEGGPRRRWAVVTSNLLLGLAAASLGHALG